MAPSSDSTDEPGRHDWDSSIPSATAQPPTLAHERDLLGCVAAELADAGIAGESRGIQLLYLIVTSRLLERPVSIAVKGPSAGGKSFLVGEVLKLFPADAFHAITAMSDRVLIYDQTPLVHRMLVVYEAAGMASEIASYLVRSLLSEGRIHYQTLVPAKGGGWSPKTVIRDGPTGLIATTTAVNLHPENETRLLSLTVNDTPAQTAAVMLANARGGRRRPEPENWHALQSWLAARSTEVVVPYAEDLVAAIPPVAIRLRRDSATLLTLIGAHAVLHQATREIDAGGRILATIDDYAAVRGLVWDLMADTAERSVSSITRDTIDAVRRLTATDYLEQGVTQTQVALELGIDKSTAMRRSRQAMSRGFLRNIETGRGRPARLIIGDPLPEDGSLLPSVPDLEQRLRGCVPEEAMPVEEDYPRSAWLADGSADEGDDLAESAERVGWSHP